MVRESDLHHTSAIIKRVERKRSLLLAGGLLDNLLGSLLGGLLGDLLDGLLDNLLGGLGCGSLGGLGNLLGSGFLGSDGSSSGHCDICFCLIIEQNRSFIYAWGLRIIII